MSTVTDHFNAFRSRLAAHSLLDNKVDTIVRIATDGKAVRANYVVAYPGIPTRLSDDRFTAEQELDSKADIEYDVRVVATSAGGLLLLLDAVLEQMIGHRLIVAGRRCTKIALDTDESDSKAQHDAKADLHFQNLTFRFTSQRST